MEADRSRADDYYLAEGTGIARRFAAAPDGRVVELAPLDGRRRTRRGSPGVDPDTGEPRGRLRNDAHAVRFVEVVVNGPKSWSLAAELHPDIAAAYDAAQDRAAEQIIGWLGQHATTRVGPRGAQVPVPVERIEAVTVRHYTSRAGDPHRHLHLQINARVFAAGQWRGLDTVAVRDSIDGDQRDRARRGRCATRSSGPRSRRTAITLDRDRGDRAARASSSGPFSKRAAQIERNIDRYEARVARDASRRGTGAGVAAGVGRAGVGRRPAGQGRPAARRGGARPVAGRTRRARLPRP